MEGPTEPQQSGDMDVKYMKNKYDEIKTKRIRLPRQAVQSVQKRKQCAKEKKAALKKRVNQILQKPETERSFEEAKILKSSSKIVKEIHQKRIKREEAKRRQEEFEDPEDILDQKCQILAQAIAQSQHLVVYTGAGISTAAKIPDYRGPDGIWTRLKEGRDIGDHDLSLAEPTYTHMALYELYRQRILKYVVSQNCDGLHLRSGLPKTALSEVHGNMYVEVCKDCKPHREYWRLFDVTESTARYSHKTYRRCYMCNGPLMDTIVHFGERGSLQWPLNWKGACKNAKEATTILCIGSSLKVLKKYPWLWQMDKPIKKRPNLYIINLQWTPKDECANVKVNGKCDVVFKKIMDTLGIQVPRYDKTKDPIFYHATALNELETHTTTRLSLDPNKEDCMDSEEDNSNTESVLLPSVINDYKDDVNEKKYSCVNGFKEQPVLLMKVELQNDCKVTNVGVVSNRKIEVSPCENENKCTNLLISESNENDNQDVLDKNISFENDNLEERLCQDEERNTHVCEEAGQKVEYSNSSKDDKMEETSCQDEENSLNEDLTLNLCKAEATSSSQSSQDETMSETNSSKDCSFSYKPDLEDLNCDTNSSNSSSEQNFAADSAELMEFGIIRNGIRQTQGFNPLLDPRISLLSYNLLQSQVFCAYPNLLLYPYQTSFLYPGLHSIINPMPVIKEELPSKLEVKDEEVDPQCEFCHKNYKSSVCVFYEKVEPVFKKELQRYSKIEKKDKPNICECCDYTTEEDDPADDSGLSEKDRLTDSISGTEQKTKVQPGWFGKGYRKGRRLKRKLL